MTSSEKGASFGSAAEAKLKNCAGIIAKLKRNINAGPFLRPVDPIALNIPDYPEKIKHPMDISTIKRKLDTHEYGSPEEFNADVELMFNNCYTYNSPDSQVYIMGKELQNYYNTLYSAAMTGPAKRTAPTSPAAQEKPKKVQTPSNTMAQEEYRRCAEILKELDGPDCRSFSSIFWEPVSAEEAPGYTRIIKQPMDLGTIRKKLEGQKYARFQEFVQDLNLVVSNCFAYNAPDSFAYECGKKLEAAMKRLVSGEEDVYSRIQDLRQKIAVMSEELRTLERQIGAKKHVFSAGERERIGRAVLDLDRVQAEKIAEIVQRHGAYEYIDNDEIEVNFNTMPDEVVREISEYLKKLKNTQSHIPSSSSEE